MGQRASMVTGCVGHSAWHDGAWRCSLQRRQLQKKNEGGHFPPSRTSAGHGCHRARHGYSPTNPDSALCSRRVRASSIQRWCERAPSRERLRRAVLSDQPTAVRRNPGRAPAAIGVVSSRTTCPKTLSGPSIRAHRWIGGASGCGARGPTASGNSFGG